MGEGQGMLEAEAEDEFPKRCLQYSDYIVCYIIFQRACRIIFLTAYSTCIRVPVQSYSQIHINHSDIINCVFHHFINHTSQRLYTHSLSSFNPFRRRVKSQSSA